MIESQSARRDQKTADSSRKNVVRLAAAFAPKATQAVFVHERKGDIVSEGEDDTRRGEAKGFPVSPTEASD